MERSRQDRVRRRKRIKAKKRLKQWSKAMLREGTGWKLKRGKKKWKG